MGPTADRRSAWIIALVCCTAASTLLAQHAFDAEEGAGIYAEACAECHGENGDLIDGVDLARNQFSRPYTDNELAALIMIGIPNTAMGPADLDEDEIEELVLYLRDLARPREEPRLAGDAERGKALFEGKGECMDCHRIDGAGSRIGPDLSRIGRFRRAFANHRQNRPFHRPHHAIVSRVCGQLQRMGEIGRVKCLFLLQAPRQSAPDLAQNHARITPRPHQRSLR